MEGAAKGQADKQTQTSLFLICLCKHLAVHVKLEEFSARVHRRHLHRDRGRAAGRSNAALGVRLLVVVRRLLRQAAPEEERLGAKEAVKGLASPGA